MGGIGAVVLLSIACAGPPELPLPRSSPPVVGAGVRVNRLEGRLSKIIARYEAPNWRCSQFIYDLQAEAKTAGTDEVLDLLARDIYTDDVQFLIYLMGPDAARLKPGLRDLAGSPDLRTRARAIKAIAAIDAPEGVSN